MNSPRKPYKIVKKLQANEELSNHKVNSARLKQDHNPSPAKFGIKPHNPRIMLMRDELDSKEIFNEKLKQIQFKEYLDLQVYQKNKNSNTESSPSILNSSRNKITNHRSFHESSLTKKTFDTAQPINDTDYFKKLEVENNKLKEELERKSDLINIMLNAFNAKTIETNNVKEINEVQSPYDLTLDEKIKKARMFSRILLQEKYATPHNKIKNAELMINASFLEGRAHKSQGNTPQLPTLKRNLRSSSPSKIKIMNKYKEKNHNDKKSIFFPKISNNPGNLDNNINMNEFTVKKTAEFAKDLSLLNLKKSKVLEKFEGKIFNKFPKGFFPNSE